MIRISRVLIAGMLLAFLACGESRPQSSDVRDAIREVVQGDTTGGSRATQTSAPGESLHSFYEQRGFEPAFVMERRNVRAALVELCGAEEHGLNKGDYLSEGLQRHIEQAFAADAPSDSVHAQRLAALDVALASTLLEYTSDVITGRVNPTEFGDSWQTPVHSIDPATVLGQAVADDSLGRISTRVSGAHPEYGALREELDRYRSIESRGGWPTVPEGEALAEGATDERVEALVRRLAASGDLDSTMVEEARAPNDTTTLSDTTAAAASALEYDERIADGVRTFQERHGLEPDGVAGESVIQAMNVPAGERARQIELNLERWRWIPAQLGGRYIYVNIPAFELHAFENGTEQMSMAVVVGEEYDDQATPVFADTMEYVVFNPYWNIPQSIAEEEILPNAREDDGYLEQNRYEIATSWSDDAEVVPPTPENLDRVESRRYRLRQQPGPQNALGRIKFMFPNEFNIYLHDTPEDYLFERAQRAYSHGCIRVERPIELGDFVLTSAEWDADRIRSAIESGERQIHNLQNPLPVYILYWTAFVDAEGRMNFREDLYGSDGELDEALRRAAPDEGAVSCDTLLAALESDS